MSDILSYSARPHIPSLAEPPPHSPFTVLRVFERPRIEFRWNPIPAAEGDAVPVIN